LSVFVQFGRRGDAFARRVLTVVALVVKGRGVALVVRRNFAPADERGQSDAVVNLLDGIGLRQVLTIVINVVDHAGVGLEERLAGCESRIELEAISESRASGGDVTAERDVYVVAHVVVEVVFVGADAGVLVWINAEPDDQGFSAVLIRPDEGVNVGSVRRRI